MKDIILKKGDMIYFSGSEYMLVDYKFDGCKAFDTLYERDVIEIKRPVKYETIYKKPQEILDKEEKKYLSAVIKPFRDRIKYIMINCYYDKEESYMTIRLMNDMVYLPNFESGTMYKGMEVDKEYTLEELGL